MPQIRKENYPSIIREDMTKVEAMDAYINSFSHKLNGNEICNGIHQIFGIQIESEFVLTKQRASTSSRLHLTNVEVIDTHLSQMRDQLTGSEIRILINEIFGINLDAIDSLEKTKISLFSKGQWIVHQETNLFVVHTGIGDIDAWVLPTNYFLEQTGEKELPLELQKDLVSLGYSYSSHVDGYYYSNPSGVAVPDAFKGKTMQAIQHCISVNYSSL